MYYFPLHPNLSDVNGKIVIYFIFYFSNGIKSLFRHGNVLKSHRLYDTPIKKNFINKDA